MGRGVRLTLTILGLALAVCAPAAAQTGAPDPYAIPRDLPVTLIADEVTYDTVTDRLTARGSVQVFYGERTLTADEIVYDRATETISATGRIAVRNPDGSTLYATAAELTPDLRDGLIEGAQAVLAQRFRIAAADAQRVGGRYNVLGTAVFSNCTVCAESPTPLWQIRARRVIHDEVARQIHYEDATFDLAGVPIFYTPYFRHPDPTLDRASGFLAPTLLAGDAIGVGVKTPYYWVIDEASDATLTPFVTTDKGLVVEGEYRRRFTEGFLSLGGALTYDDGYSDGDWRGVFDGDGYHYLTDTAFARFDARIASDDAFLSDYEYSTTDRIDSEAVVADYRRSGYWELGAAYFQSFREEEPDGTLPRALPEFDLRQNLGQIAGGALGLTLNSYTLLRTSGQDSARATAILDWERTWMTDPGVLLRGFGDVQGDAFRAWQVPGGSEDWQARVTPTIGGEARYPLIRSTPRATHVVEPVGQLIWSDATGDTDGLQNEDSLLVEFDETNLFDTSRFAGYDRVETGLRANLGLRYERMDADGWTIGTLVGRTFRTGSEDGFEDIPGLSDQASAYVGAVSLSLPPYLTLVNRVLIRDDASLDRNELRLDAAYAPVTLSGSYLFLSRQVQGGTAEAAEEAAFDAGVALTPNWTVGAVLRYDIDSDSVVRAGGRIGYGNECIEVDLSVTRRFTRSQSVDASTAVGLSVRLAGLGSDLKRVDRSDRCRMMVR